MLLRFRNNAQRFQIGCRHGTEPPSTGARARRRTGHAERAKRAEVERKVVADAQKIVPNLERAPGRGPGAVVLPDHRRRNSQLGSPGLPTSPACGSWARRIWQARKGLPATPPCL